MKQRLGLFSFLLVVGSLTVCTAEDTSDERIEQALVVTTNWARRYEFRREGDDGQQALKRSEGSILRWSNPVAGELYGNVFVWTHRGRPEIVGSLLQWFSPHTHGSHEFHSLSTEPIAGGRDGRLLWEYDQPGVKLMEVPRGSDVADRPVVRLRQMRAIARRFSVEKTDREQVQRNLRLLSQPLVRFGDDESEIVDGGAVRVRAGDRPRGVFDGRGEKGRREAPLAFRHGANEQRQVRRQL